MDLRRRETSWRSPSGEWKRRYSTLYSTRRLSLHKEDNRERCISFMSNQEDPISSITVPYERSSLLGSRDPSLSNTATISLLSQQSPGYTSCVNTPTLHVSEDLGEHGTMLLNMVRERNRQASVMTQPLELPKADEDDEKGPFMEMDTCFHSGWNARATERSYSRSRISRVSTKRDMDIPSLIAFTSNMQDPEPVKPIKNMEFQQAQPQEQEIPRWSIRRFACPVCSQKWRDRSSIDNVKNSGLKKNVSADLTSIRVPARLRTYITLGYAPRPALVAVDEEAGALRTTGPAWQFTRARKFRCIKPVLPPEATAPPSATAPKARKGLDTRLHKFISDLQMDTEDTDSRQKMIFESNSPIAFNI